MPSCGDFTADTCGTCFRASMSRLGIPDTLVARPYSAAPALPLLRQCAPLRYQTDGVAGRSAARKQLQQQRQASDPMHALLYERVDM